MLRVIKTLLFALAAVPVVSLGQIGFKDRSGMAIVPQGLVFYLPMDASSVGKGLAVDWSGKGNSATITGAPALAAGQVNQGLQFSGSGQWASKSSASGLNNTTFTILAWVKLSSTGQSSRYVFTYRDSGDFYSLIYGFNTGKFEVYSDKVGIRQALGGTVSDTAWHHIAFSYDGTVVRAWQDGVGNTNATKGVTLPTAVTTAFVATSQGSLNMIAATIDELRVYNRALSTNEVGQIYQAGH